MDTGCLPMTESVVGVVLLPNAHIHRAPPGTWIRQKLHWLLKYFGKKLADAKLQTSVKPSQHHPLTALWHTYTALNYNYRENLHKPPTALDDSNSQAE